VQVFPGQGLRREFVLVTHEDYLYAVLARSPLGSCLFSDVRVLVSPFTTTDMAVPDPTLAGAPPRRTLYRKLRDIVLCLAPDGMINIARRVRRRSFQR
jgi:hypothetical protein